MENNILVGLDHTGEVKLNFTSASSMKIMKNILESAVTIIEERINEEPYEYISQEDSMRILNMCQGEIEHYELRRFLKPYIREGEVYYDKERVDNLKVYRYLQNRNEELSKKYEKLNKDHNKLTAKLNRMKKKGQ